MFTITSLFVRARNSVISTCSHDSSLNDHQRSPTPPYEIPEEPEEAIIVESEESPAAAAVVEHSNSSTSNSSYELPYELPMVLHFPPPPSYPPPPIPPNTPRRVRFSFDPPEEFFWPGTPSSHLLPPLAEPETSIESSPELRHHHPLHPLHPLQQQHNLFSIRDVIESDESGFDNESAYGDSFDSSSTDEAAEDIYVTAPGTPDSGSFMENVAKEDAMEKYNILLKEI
uniref:Uncharacterized protein n=1 Tax=Panagrolaimus superbus TaxID=310955 RepID=A0A914Y7W5_9BILA